MASSVVEHNREAALASKSGGGGGPLTVPCRLSFFGAPVLESMDVDESLAPSCRRRSSWAVEARGDVRLMFGNTRRFCLEGGKISSRSTGTPKDTRNNRRILLRVQFGGCIGGGDTSCCQSESERSERKGELFVMSSGGSVDGGAGESGKMASR